MKQRKLITISFVVGLLALVLGSTAALGQEGTSQIGDRFQVRLANILGIDTTTLVNAFSQARAEVKTQEIEERIQDLLASGKITEDQVDEVREKMENHKHGKVGPKGPLSPEQIEERIQDLLASGKITEDQVDEVREKMENRKMKPLRPNGSSGYGSNQVSTQLT